MISNLEQIIKNELCNGKEITPLVTETFNVLRNYKDSSLEELTSILLKDIIEELEQFIKLEYPVPGITTGFKVGLINAEINMGHQGNKQTPITSDTLYDLASITKLYTVIIAYNLINEGYFNFNSKISDLYPDFALNNVTIGDILSFNVELKTNGRIDKAKSYDEAIDRLYKTKLINKGKYIYTDIGMMILKEVMERVTNTSFEELFNRYIVKPLSLNNTYLTVPSNKRCFITGTPNYNLGFPNDPKAAILGGYYTHAGIFANSADLIRLGEGLFTKDKLFNTSYIDKFYTQGIEPNRGKFGYVYIPNLGDCNNKLSFKKSFLATGSTRTLVNVSNLKIYNNEYTNVTTLLMNPCSTPIEELRQIQIEINKNRIENSLPPIELTKSMEFLTKDNRTIRAMTVDMKKIISNEKLVSISKTLNRVKIKLLLLNEVVRSAEPNYDKKVNVKIYKKI